MSKKTGKNAAHAAVRKAYRRAAADYRALEREWKALPQDTLDYPGVKPFHKAADLALNMSINQIRRKLGRAAYKRQDWVDLLDGLVKYQKSLPR